MTWISQKLLERLTRRLTHGQATLAARRCAEATA